MTPGYAPLAQLLSRKRRCLGLRRQPFLSADRVPHVVSCPQLSRVESYDRPPTHARTGHFTIQPSSTQLNSTPALQRADTRAGAPLLCTHRLPGTLDVVACPQRHGRAPACASVPRPCALRSVSPMNFLRGPTVTPSTLSHVPTLTSVPLCPRHHTFHATSTDPPQSPCATPHPSQVALEMSCGECEPPGGHGLLAAVLNGFGACRGPGAKNEQWVAWRRRLMLLVYCGFCVVALLSWQVNISPGTTRPRSWNHTY